MTRTTFLMRKVVIHPAQIPSKGDRPTDEGTSERGGGEGARLAQEVIRALHMHRARAARAQGRDKAHRHAEGAVALFVTRAEPVARRRSAC